MKFIYLSKGEGDNGLSHASGCNKIIFEDAFELILLQGNCVCIKIV